MHKKIIPLLLVSVLLSGCNFYSNKNSNKNADKTAASDTNHSINSAEQKNTDTQEIKSNGKGSIFDYSSNRLIDNSELEHYDKFSLLLAKNELFARKGYRFKEKDLFDYFNNMDWYKPDDTVKGTFESLNDIEKQNFNLINNFKTKQMKYKQSVKKDINNDGNIETISVEFKNDLNNCLNEYTLTVDSDGKEYKITGSAENLNTKIFFADFNVSDSYTEFYLTEDGPSDDPGVIVFRFTPEGIKEVLELAGYITAFDGKGKIYTEFSKTHDKNKVTLSYYDLEKGLIYPSISETKGKYLQYNSNLILFKSVRDETGKSAPFMSGTNIHDEKELEATYNKDLTVKVSHPNEKLKIVDIDYDIYKDIGIKLVRNIPVKVEAEDGKQGWLMWLNGGD